MIHELDEFLLRKPEPKDIEALYGYKNDPVVAASLGGFSFGYSRADIADWIESHRRRTDEIVWVVASQRDDRCVGQVGLYQIDYRIRKAEFAIMLGDAAVRGKGLGRQVTRHVLGYGFDFLHLNRVELNLLATNEPARRLYQSLGFHEEGVLRQAQYKAGRYVDVVLMSLLRSEFEGTS